jgi:hypothetical protein
MRIFVFKIIVNGWQLTAVGDFRHYSSNTSLMTTAIGILPVQIFQKALNRPLLVCAATHFVE